MLTYLPHTHQKQFLFNDKTAIPKSVTKNTRTSSVRGKERFSVNCSTVPNGSHLVIKEYLQDPLPYLNKHMQSLIILSDGQRVTSIFKILVPSFFHKLCILHGIHANCEREKK